MEKFKEWFQLNRTSIGYFVGGCNVLSGVTYLAQDNVIGGIFWLLLGAFIIFDTKEFK